MLMFPESQALLSAHPGGDLTVEQIEQLLPERPLVYGLRQRMAEILWLRYCQAFPITYEQIGKTYGVSRARIQQLVSQTLDDLIEAGVERLPPATRLRFAAERRSQFYEAVGMLQKVG